MGSLTLESNTPPVALEPFWKNRPTASDTRQRAEPFPANDVHDYGPKRNQGSPMDKQTKKELWVLAISASAVPLVAGIAAFLIR